jgi:hypothetical protein
MPKWRKIRRLGNLEGGHVTEIKRAPQVPLLLNARPRTKYQVQRSNPVSYTDARSTLLFM